MTVLTPARAVNARLATAQPKSTHLAPSDDFSFPAPPANPPPHWAAAMLTAQISNPAPSVSPRPADAPQNSSQHPPDSVCRAVVAGSPSRLLRLLQRGESATIADGDGLRPLHHAARHGRLECAKILLAHGARADAPSDDAAAETAVHAAARAGQVAIARLLAAQQPDAVVRRDAHGDAPLHAAAAGGHVEFVRAVLNGDGAAPWRAALEAPNALGDGALACAARCGQLECARALLNLGAAVDGAKGATRPLIAAVRGAADGAVVGLLVGGGARLDADDAADEPPPLHVAVDHGAPPRLASLLAAERAGLREVDGRGRTALHAAVLGGAPSSVASLLEAAGADGRRFLCEAVDSGGEPPLHLALRLRRPAVVDALLANGADPALADAAGRRPLQMAAAMDAAAETRLLLRALAAAGDATAVDGDAMTVAARAGATRALGEHLDALAAAGADIFGADGAAAAELREALGAAVNAGAAEAAAQIVELAPWAASAAAPDGSTALHAAALAAEAAPGEAPAVLASILRARADVSATDANGERALDVAARADAVGAVRALLKAGAGETTTALVAAVRARAHRAMALLAPAAAAAAGDDDARAEPLVEAARRDDATSMAILLTSAAPAAQLKAMRAAAAAGALTALQAVLQHGGTKLPIDGTADDDRCTALHIAAFRGHDDCVAALVTAGASAGARNRLGLAPADLATQEAPQDPACFRE